MEVARNVRRARSPVHIRKRFRHRQPCVGCRRVCPNSLHMDRGRRPDRRNGARGLLWRDLGTGPDQRRPAVLADHTLPCRRNPGCSPAHLRRVHGTVARILPRSRPHRVRHAAHDQSLPPARIRDRTRSWSVLFRPGSRQGRRRRRAGLRWPDRVDRRHRCRRHHGRSARLPENVDHRRRPAGLRRRRLRAPCLHRP